MECPICGYDNMNAYADNGRVFYSCPNCGYPVDNSSKTVHKLWITHQKPVDKPVDNSIKKLFIHLYEMSLLTLKEECLATFLKHGNSPLLLLLTIYILINRLSSSSIFKSLTGKTRKNSDFSQRSIGMERGDPRSAVLSNHSAYGTLSISLGQGAASSNHSLPLIRWRRSLAHSEVTP